jgi:hypothetical protein
VRSIDQLRQIAYAEKQIISYFRIFGTNKKEVVRIFLGGARYVNSDISHEFRGCRGRYRMVLEFTNAYGISAYHH